MKKDEYLKKYSSLKKKIGELGFICTGSVFSAFNTCGNPNCRCHKDKSARHGPYNIWTRKVKAKTITRTLTSISTVLRRANAEAFMSVACQEKAILRRLPPNHGMGVGSSARLEATR